MKLGRLLAATALIAMTPIRAEAQTAPGTPAFRVPIGQPSSASAAPRVYAWMENVATCSSSCGPGTRTTVFQCQDIANYDFTGSGYGAPEPDASCSATSPKPASSTKACENYSGCSYDWVKPAVKITRIAKPGNPTGGTFPIGQDDDCTFGRRVFSPYCKRTSGSPVTMPASDHAFCRNDRPDYDAVASGDADALGYDRTVDVTTSCTPGSRDYGWKSGQWSSPSTTCGAAPTHTRSVECVLKFNGQGATDDKCVGMTKPTTNETMPADFTGCSLQWETGPWGSYSSSCSDSATRTRTVLCRRSDGTAVGDTLCSSAGVKPATSESGPNVTGCSYAWGTPSAWSYASQCSTSTTRTRTVTCQRSDGRASADSNCTAAKPVTSESGISNLTNCTYAPRDMGRTACANSQLLQYWDCTRSDGTVGFPASMCGKTNPETQSCTMPPPVYTYVPVNRGETACSGSQKLVYWDCTRNDGTTGFPASMCGKTSPETQSCVMPSTFAWAATGWSAASSNCSANASQTRTVYCRRDQDGAQVSDASCVGTKPNSVQYVSNFTGCGYTPAYGSWTNCSNSTQSRPVSCTRSDGVNVDPSLCGISASGGQQSQSCVSNPYPPVYGKTCGPNKSTEIMQCPGGFHYTVRCLGGTVIYGGSWSMFETGNPGGVDPMTTPGYCITTYGNDMWQNGSYIIRRDALLRCVPVASNEPNPTLESRLEQDCVPQYYLNTVRLPTVYLQLAPADLRCTGAVISSQDGSTPYSPPVNTQCVQVSGDFAMTYYHSGPPSKADQAIYIVEYTMR